jgi:hypothetical protein
MDDRDRYLPNAGTYCPRTFEELASDPIPTTLLNEPLPPDNVSTLPVPRARSIHATLVESLNSTQALLRRLSWV